MGNRHQEDEQHDEVSSKITVRFQVNDKRLKTFDSFQPFVLQIHVPF